MQHPKREGNINKLPAFTFPQDLQSSVAFRPFPASITVITADTALDRAMVKSEKTENMTLQ